MLKDPSQIPHNSHHFTIFIHLLNYPSSPKKRFVHKCLIAIKQVSGIKRDIWYAEKTSRVALPLGFLALNRYEAIKIILHRINPWFFSLVDGLSLHNLVCYESAWRYHSEVSEIWKIVSKKRDREPTVLDSCIKSFMFHSDSTFPNVPFNSIIE